MSLRAMINVRGDRKPANPERYVSKNPVMKVTNIHKRVIHQSKDKVSKILDSLSSKDDQLWPNEQWPPMVFRKGLSEGAIGGHVPIKYSIQKYIPGNTIEFKFIKPDGFKGIHKFEITELDSKKTEIKHTIKMSLSGKGVLTWYLAIKWLHDALLEDCLDKVESHFLQEPKSTKWNVWVCMLMKILQKK